MMASITHHPTPHYGDRVQIRPGTHVGAKLVGALIGHIRDIRTDLPGGPAVRIDDERTGPDACLPVWVLAEDTTPLPRIEHP